MIETGLAIFLGLVFIFIKLKRRTMLRLLRHDMAIDVDVTMETTIRWSETMLPGHWPRKPMLKPNRKRMPSLNGLMSPAKRCWHWRRAQRSKDRA